MRVNAAADGLKDEELRREYRRKGTAGLDTPFNIDLYRFYIDLYRFVLIYGFLFIDFDRFICVLIF